jgi:hypothetical protein
MKNLLCLIGRHRWVESRMTPRSNGSFVACRWCPRCGADRKYCSGVLGGMTNTAIPVPKDDGTPSTKVTNDKTNLRAVRNRKAMDEFQKMLKAGLNERSNGRGD